MGKKSKTKPKVVWNCIQPGLYATDDRCLVVFREHGKWYRLELPPATMRLALASAHLTPFGAFSRGRGPFDTLGAAKSASPIF